MFGAMGVALAAPLLAVGRIAVLRFYVEDWLRTDRALRCAARPALRHGLVDPLEEVGKERIGRHAQQRIEIDDQHAALAARRDGAEIDAEILRRRRARMP